MLSAKVAAVILRGPVPLELDSLGYWSLSTLVIEGDLLMTGEPIAYRTPFYPWFLAAVRSVAGKSSLWVISLIQGGCAIGAIVIAAHLARRITKLPLAGPLTLIVAIPTLSAHTFCAAILSETLFVFLLMLNLLAVVDYCKYETPGRAAWVGVTFGIALLTRPVMLMLWIPHLIFVFAIHLRKRRRLKANVHRIGLGRRLGHGLICAVVTVMLCAPWVLRNVNLFGDPMLTEFMGRNIWIVTFQEGSGAGLSLPDGEASNRLTKRLERVGATDDWRSTWAVSNALVKSGLSDPAADRLMRASAEEAIALDRGTFAYKAFRRCVNFWRCAATDLPAQGDPDGEYLGQFRWQFRFPALEWLIEHRWSRSVMGNTVVLGILVGALLVLIVTPTTRPYGLWLAMILGYFSVVTGLLEIPAYRYRMVVEPLICLAIGAAAAVVLSRRRQEATLAT